jgi:alpha-tubulin suppressor-like RCC1 family protein
MNCNLRSGGVSRIARIGATRSLFIVSTLVVIFCPLAPGASANERGRSPQPPAGGAAGGSATVSIGPGSGLWTSVDAGNTEACGIQTDASLWCWGFNFYGQLGLGDKKTRLVPTRVGASHDWSSVSAGESSSVCGIRADHSLWCWGANASGSLGTGDRVDRDTPTKVGTARWLHVTVGNFYTCGIQLDHSLWCWGSNSVGQLGVGDTLERLTPTRVSGRLPWLSVESGSYSTCGIRLHHTLWCWGANARGGLGLPGPGNRVSPARVGDGANWISVSVGFFDGCGVRSTMTLWCWGNNRSGELGLPGRPQSQHRPALVGRNWAHVRTGSTQTCGIRPNQTLWCWGENSEGQLGLGDTKNRYVPTQVGTRTNWRNASAGTIGVLGLRVNNNLWSWGANDEGELGLGDRRERLYPNLVTS